MRNIFELAFNSFYCTILCIDVDLAYGGWNVEYPHAGPRWYCVDVCNLWRRRSRGWWPHPSQHLVSSLCPLVEASRSNHQFWKSSRMNATMGAVRARYLLRRRRNICHPWRRRSSLLNFHGDAVVIFVHWTVLLPFLRYGCCFGMMRWLLLDGSGPTLT